jgi:hypothetical protein
MDLEPTYVSSNRRRFLKELCAGGLAASSLTFSATKAKAEDSEALPPVKSPAPIPQVTIAGVRIPRMIIGSNPIGGWSHSVRNLSLAMPDYFTLERTVAFVRRCEGSGLDVWLSYWSEKPLKALRTLWAGGSKIRPFFLGKLNAERQLCGAESEIKEDLRSYRPLFCVHHGSKTDSLFRSGQHQVVHDFVKKVHDELGIPAGVSAHNPANIQYMEDQGWEVDLYQTCLYYVTRPKEEIRAKLGTALLDEPYLESDRDEMLKVIQQVKKPCLAFKILGAGRLCGSDQSVEEAFQYTLSRIKKTDAVIVGFWPKFKDELSQNIRLLCKYGSLTA